MTVAADLVLAQVYVVLSPKVGQDKDRTLQDMGPEIECVHDCCRRSGSSSGKGRLDSYSWIGQRQDITGHRTRDWKCVHDHCREFGQVDLTLKF